jgi:polygalacturonase
MCIYKISSSAVLLLLFCFQTIISYAQTIEHYSKDVEARITQVENSLAGRVMIKGKPAKWSLADRMKFYHANGVSIAVIKDYKIEWAKAMAGQTVRSNDLSLQQLCSRQVPIANRLTQSVF